MKVRTRISNRIHSDIPPAIVALLIDCGLGMDVVREQPLPFPAGAQWSARTHQFSQQPVIVRTNGAEMLIFNGCPDATKFGKCPDPVVAEFNRLVDLRDARLKADHEAQVKLGRG